MIKVIYLTWGETPRSYGLYRSQVIDVLCNLKKTDSQISYELISAIPIINSGLVKEKLAYKNEIKNIKDTLSNSGVSFKICPIFSTQNFVYPTKLTFPLIFLGSEIFLYRHLSKSKPSIIHCRSFLATHMAYKIKIKYNLDYKIIYDVRSLWPEVIQRRRPNITNYSFFKELEKKIVRNVEAIVSVNPQMSSHFEIMGSRISVVNYLAAKVLKNNPPTLSEKYTGELKVLYLGALGNDTIQDPQILFHIFKNIKELFDEAKLTIISTSSHSKLKKIAFEYFGYQPAFITYLEERDRERLQVIIEEHNIAINAYRKPLSESDELLFSTGFSTKSVEYLASGLPIISSPYPQAICKILLENNIGLVFDDKLKNGGISKRKILKTLEKSISKKARDLAFDKFDYSKNAEVYLSLYHSLLK